MANYSTSLTTWADSGSSYPSDYSYAEGESPVDDWDDYLAYHTIEDIQHLVGLTNTLDTDLYNHTGDTTNPHSVDHSQLSGVGSGDHHTRYADSEAVSAVNAETSLSVDISGDADTVDGYHAGDLGSDVSDSGTLAVSKATDINFGSNIDVTDDGDGTVTVDGTPGYTDSDARSAINTDGDHGSTASHNYYTDSEAVSAVNAETSLSVDISGDADTVDGYHANDLSRPKNNAQLTSTDTSTNINQSSWTAIPWNKQLDVDAGYTHDPSSNPEQITFDDGGTYRVHANISYDANGNARTNPGIRFAINGSNRSRTGLTGYVRSASGHNEGSNVLTETITVNAGDTLTVRTYQFGSSGTCTMRSDESVLLVEQVSETVARSEDADTLDGYHAADLQKTGTSSQGNVTTGGATVIDDIYVDGDGHVTNLNTQNRTIDDWANSGNASNNNVDADTVDGKHASDMGGVDESAYEGFAPGFAG